MLWAMTAPVGRLGPVPDRGSIPPNAQGGLSTAKGGSPTARGGSSAAAGHPTVDAADRGGSRSAPEVLAAICPYLVASNGAWRAAVPLRDHRCGAQEPPGRLALDTQQSLCLTSAHLGCPLFEAAAGPTADFHAHQAARNAAGASTSLDTSRASADVDAESVGLFFAGMPVSAAVDPGPTHRPIPRTTPVVLDRSRGLGDAHLPSIQVPSVRLPPVWMPCLRLPSFHLPSFHLPRDLHMPGFALRLPSGARSEAAAQTAAAASRDRIAELRAARMRARSAASPAEAGTATERVPPPTGASGARLARPPKPPIEPPVQDTRGVNRVTQPPRRPPSIPGSSGFRRFGGSGEFGTVGRGARGGLGTVRGRIAGREAQTALAGLMVLALVAVLFVRFGPAPTGGVAPATSSPRGSGAPVVAGSPAPARSPATGASSAAVSAVAGSLPAASPSRSPKPTAKPARTYRVKPGDTLSAIAARYHTTVAILQRLNNITDPRKLQAGQVLKLP
jgi:hypothetical protein